METTKQKKSERKLSETLLEYYEKARNGPYEKLSDETKRKYSNVTDYIASLILTKRRKFKIPREKKVREVLEALANHVVMGELGFGAECLEETLKLHYLVVFAATRHARLIGRNSEKYVEKYIGE